MTDTNERPDPCPHGVSREHWQTQPKCPHCDELDRLRAENFALKAKVERVEKLPGKWLIDIGAAYVSLESKECVMDRANDLRAALNEEGK